MVTHQQELTILNDRIALTEAQQEKYRDNGQEDAAKRLEKELKQMYLKRRRILKKI